MISDAEVDAAVFPVVFDGVGDDVHHDAAGNDHRQEKYRSRQQAAAEILIKDDRDEQRKHADKRHMGDHRPERRGKSRQKLAIFHKHPPVILPAWRRQNHIAWLHFHVVKAVYHG